MQGTCTCIAAVLKQRDKTRTSEQLKVHDIVVLLVHVYQREHVSHRRRQGASDYVHAFSAFRIRTVGNTLCGGIVVIAT